MKLVKPQTATTAHDEPALSAQPIPMLPERRKAPRTWDTPPAPAPPPHLDDYQSIVGAAVVDELRFLARELKGKTVKMVNSTAVGGGVAEMLNRLVPLLGELEVATHWDVITGGNDFFEVTKAFHNALHGSEYQLTRAAQEIFLAYNEQNRQRMQFTEDMVVIHDPQPAALIGSQQGFATPAGCGAAISIYRIRIRKFGDFCGPFIEQYDAAIFSSQSFARQLPIPQYLFYPCIDPLSEKNKELDESFVQKVCDEFGIDRSRPDRHPGLPLRSIEGSGGRGAGFQTGQKIRRLPTGAGRRRSQRRSRRRARAQGG